MRKLASVRQVSEVLPIPNADAIELVKIDGWNCVTEKGRFQPGDLGVFFEIDSVLPDFPEYAWLWTKKGEQAGPRPGNFRIKTMKLRGALSQGVLMKLNEVVPHPDQELIDPIKFALDDFFQPGEDLTEVLGVTKYEPPESGSSGQRKGNFPAFIPKTDETRIQNVISVLEELRGKPYVATLKYDGTSATYYIDPDTKEFNACSRNQIVQEGDNDYWRIARKYNLKYLLDDLFALGFNYAIQGEIYGPGIQKNRLGVKELDFAVFDMYDISGQQYLTHTEVTKITRLASIPSALVVESGQEFNYTLDESLTKAEGKYLGTTNEREGLVWRSLGIMYSDRLQGRLSFKTISNKFLLGEKD